MREQYKKQIDESRPMFSLTVGELISVLRSTIEDAKREDARIVPLDLSFCNDQEFSIEGLMNFLGCSKASVHNYKKRGLPFYRVGRKVLFRKEEVLTFMKDRCQKTSRVILRRTA
jgi:excisionase family DNA binding protein